MQGKILFLRKSFQNRQAFGRARCRGPAHALFWSRMDIERKSVKVTAMDCSKKDQVEVTFSLKGYSLLRSLTCSSPLHKLTGAIQKLLFRIRKITLRRGIGRAFRRGRGARVQPTTATSFLHLMEIKIT